MKYALVDSQNEVARVIDWHETGAPVAPSDKNFVWLPVEHTDPQVTGAQKFGAVVFVVDRQAGVCKTTYQVIDKTKIEYNAPIVAALLDIDMKSIRALRTNDEARKAQLETQATALRATLMP